jgi:hypothetical protein
MKPQLFATFGRIVCVLSFFSAIFALPARSASPPPPAPPACTSLNLPTGPTAYVATATNLVTVLDAAANTAVCTVTVGTNPGNLAVSPDSKLLFVENDTDGTVSVVDLSTGTVTNTLSITGTPMTANLAVSPDNSKVYVVTLPSVLTPTTQASLYVISLPSLVVSAPTTITEAVPTYVTAAGLGIAFTPDATLAYIATESTVGAGLTYIVNTAGNTISTTTVAVSGGSVAIDQSGTYAYVVDVTTTLSAPVSQILISANTVTTLNAITLNCTQGNTIAVPPLPTINTIAYYSCQGGHFIQAVDFSSGTPNTAVQTVAVSLAAHPLGLFITSDGKAAYVALDDGTVAIVNTSVNPNLLSATTITLTGAARGIVQRPVQITPLTPTTASVPTGLTQAFTSSVLYAFSTGQTLTWGVNGVTGGNIATTGSVSTAGVYTAPNAIPATPVVTVSDTSSEVPAKSLLYPLTAAVTITPSQLVFTTQPTGVTAGTPFTAAVSVEDASGVVDTTSTVSVTITSASAPVGAAAVTGTLTVTAVAGVATFNNLVLTQVGTGPYNYTLTASMTSAPPPILTSGNSTPFTIAPGAATKLVITGLGAQTAGNSQSLTITAQDGFGNTATTYTGDKSLTFSGANSSSSPVTAPTVTDKTGTAQTFGTPTTVTFTNGVNTAGGSMTLFKAETAVVAATDGTISTTGADRLTVVVSAAALGQFALSLTSPQANGVAFTGVNTLTAEDSWGNVATTFDASANNVTISVNAALTGAVSGLGTGGNNVLNRAPDFTLGIANLTALGMKYTGNTATGSFTATSATAKTGTSGNVTILPGAAAKLVITGSGAQTAGTSQSLTITAEDISGNTATTYSGDKSLTFSGANPSTNPVTNPTVTDKTGTARNFGTATTVTFTSGVNTAGGSMTLFKAETATIAATDGTISATLLNRLTVVVSPAAANKLVFTTQPVSTALGGNVTPLAPVVVDVQDAFGNNIPGSTAAVTMALSTPLNLVTPAGTNANPVVVNAVAGFATFNALYINKTGPPYIPYTLAASSPGLISATSTTFTPTDTITVTITSTITTVKIEDAPGADLFTAVANNDPNTPSLGVTWTMVSCGAGTLSLCGTINANTGAYTPPGKVPALAPNNTFVVQATSVADPSKTSAPLNVTLTSTITVTNVAPTTVKIEDLPAGTDTFTATVANDPNLPAPGLGVTWTMVSCGAGTLSLCGTINANTGAYTPPAKVPALAPNNTFVVQATSIADPNKTSVVVQVTLTSTITVTNVTPTTVKIEDLPAGTDTFTATVANDPNLPAPGLGVTWTMVSCGAGALNLCGTINANTGAYTPPGKVPALAPNNTFVAQASSVADPNKTSVVVQVTLTSNITVALSVVAPSTNPVAIRFQDSVLATVANDPNNPGLGVMTWSVNGIAGGNAAVGTIVSTGTTTATYTAPTTAPAAGLAVTVSAISVADQNMKSAAFTITVVPDLFSPNPLPTPSISIASTVSSGDTVINILGPVVGDGVTFTVQCTAFGTLTNASCSLTPASNAVTGTVTAAGVVTPGTGDTTPFDLVLTVTRTATAPPNVRQQPSSRPGGGVPPALALGLALALALLALSLLRRMGMPVPKTRQAFAMVFLLCLLVGWASACSQFGTPETPTAPVVGTKAATGNLTVTVTPSVGAFAKLTISVPYSVN